MQSAVTYCFLVTRRALLYIPVHEWPVATVLLSDLQDRPPLCLANGARAASPARSAERNATRESQLASLVYGMSFSVRGTRSHLQANPTTQVAEVSRLRAHG